MIRRRPITKYRRRQNLYRSTTVPQQLQDKGIKAIKFIAYSTKFPQLTTAPVTATGGSHTLAQLLNESTYWSSVKLIYQYFTIAGGFIEIIPSHFSFYATSVAQLPNLQICYDPEGELSYVGTTNFPGKFTYAKYINLGEQKTQYFSFKNTNIQPVDQAMSTAATLNDTVKTFGSIRIGVQGYPAEFDGKQHSVIIYRLYVYLWGSKV